MYNYSIVDTHCDTIGEIYGSTSLRSSIGHLDIERMKQYKNWLQVFAVWTDAAQGYNRQKREQERIISHFYDEIEKNSSKIVHVKTYCDIENAWKENKIAAVLGIEGADTVKCADDIDELYGRGVRCITITWNGSNLLASGVGDEKADFGLTKLGKCGVKKMNELGIVVDVSHISERAFWDVLDVSRLPVTATHSNSKAVCPHRRNLTDSQFKALCKNGGVAGINYYPQFVNGTDIACIDDIVRHIEHFCALGGENNIGLGGDFDGIDTTPSDLCGVQDVYKLLDRLLQLNYAQQTVEKIAHGNFLRLLGAVMK